MTDGASEYEAYPAAALSLDVEVTFAHPAIGTQRGTYLVTPDTFAEELAPGAGRSDSSPR